MQNQSSQIESDYKCSLKSKHPVPSKNLLKKVIIKICAILAGAVLYTVGIEMFVDGQGFISGGVWGIALIIQEVTSIPAKYMILALNFPLLVASIIFLGWKFTAYTFLFIGSQTLCASAFSWFNIPRFQSDDTLLAAIAAGVMMGVGLALCLKVGGSTGGTDIISVIVQKKASSINVSWVIFIINATIVGASFFAFGGIEGKGLNAVILSLILEFVASKVADVILGGFSSAIRFEIVTTRGAELQDAIIHKLDRGATILDARGGYTNNPNTLIICLIHKRQISAFNKVLHDIDPNAFAYISTVSSVHGKGFSDDPEL